MFLSSHLLKFGLVRKSSELYIGIKILLLIRSVKKEKHGSILMYIKVQNTLTEVVMYRHWFFKLGHHLLVGCNVSQFSFVKIWLSKEEQ